MDKNKKLKAGHYEIQGETIAKFELFENGWNPYSRYLDIDKVDLILRKRNANQVIYREIQVKFGKLFKCGVKWEQNLFEITSWKIFKKDEFKKFENSRDLFLIYVLAQDEGYNGDIFIFPINEFSDILSKSLKGKSKNGEIRKLNISKQGDQWYARRNAIKKQKCIKNATCINVTKYRRNFDLLN